MIRYKFLLNHKQDEAYMAQMCREGWAALRLVEGFWTFEPCQPGEYVYRVAYLRGKSPAEVEALKQQWAARGIEFVSKYFFWVILRSHKDFRLYTPEEERALCKEIRVPMAAGAAVSAVVFFASVWLAAQVSGWFWLLGALAAVYGVLCASLAGSYTKLLKEIQE